MAYEILSIGDAEMLHSAFQGAAMIFGNNNLNKLINAGFTLGLLMISFRYLTNQEFPLRHGIVGIIMYSTMFIPKDTVIIEDVYTGETRAVANVPLGLAAPMSIISTMGVTMTDMFETAFSTPTEASLLENGYLNSLNTLIKLRNIGAGTYNSNSLIEGDLGKSINSYIENCVMFDLELPTGPHEVTKESLQKSKDLWLSMKTTFINIDLLVKLPTQPDGVQKNCKDAYDAITLYLNDYPFKHALDLHVSGMLGIKESQGTAVDAIESASAALGNIIDDSQKFMENALLASYLKDGPQAFIARPAKDQLNLQWASEQSMFNEIEKPLLAFIEVFTVATSPIVAFLSTLGPIGMSMMVRYVQMMLWIALWGPVMAICNLYITIATTRSLEIVSMNAISNGSGLEAMIMHDQVYAELEKWLSAGGMLASSVPALSLMLVYGGSVAATNLSGKMTSGASSKINTSSMAPDPISVDSPIKFGARQELSPNVGAKRSGMADTVFSASSTFGRATQSARDSLRSASSSASETLSKMNQISNRSGTMSSQASAVTSAMNKTITDGSSWSSSDGKTTSSSQKMSEQESEQVTAAVQGALGAKLGGNKSIFGAAVESQLIANSGWGAARAKEIADLSSHVVNSGMLGSDITTTSSGTSNTSTNQSFESSEEMEALGKQYQSQLQAVKQASEKYTQTSSLQDSSVKSLSMPYQDLARRLVNSGALADIKNAQEKLRSEMGANDYAALSKNAQYEINNSSAVLEPGSHERDALSGFLMLNEQDPAKAAEIVNRILMPTNTESGVPFGHDAYANDSVGVDGIVSQQMANGFRSKASGDGEDFDGDDGSNSGKGKGSSGSVGVQHSGLGHQIPHHEQGSARKTMTHTAEVKNKETSSHGSGGKSGNPNLKSKVANELSGHKNKDQFDAYLSKFKDGEHLNPDKVNGTEMLLNAGKNWSNAVDDIARDGTIEAHKKIDPIQNDITNAAKQSVDAIKESFGINKKERSKSDLPNLPSNNDRPPIK